MPKHKSTATRALALKRPPKRAASLTKAPAAPPRRSLYAVHPGIAMLARWVNELATKTGRSLDEWVRHIKQAGPRTEKEARVWLKDQYQLGTNAAGWLAEKAFVASLESADDTPEGYLRAAPVYVKEMYAGPRVALRPIHDELVQLAQLLGDDVRICPCKTTVPLYRRHVFAQIRPASHKRIELGLALGEEPFTSRLRDTGGLKKKDRITHSVALSTLADIDLQVKRWLKQAYQRDA